MCRGRRFHLYDNRVYQDLCGARPTKKDEHGLPRRFDLATVVGCELQEASSYSKVTRRERRLWNRILADDDRPARRI
jgi:hypothetical protein